MRKKAIKIQETTSDKPIPISDQHTDNLATVQRNLKEIRELVAETLNPIGNKRRLLIQSLKPKKNLSSEDRTPSSIPDIVRLATETTFILDGLDETQETIKLRRAIAALLSQIERYNNQSHYS